MIEQLTPIDTQKQGRKTGRKLFASVTAALAFSGAVAGCNSVDATSSPDSSNIECTGMQQYEVKPTEGLDQIVEDHVGGITSDKEAHLVSVALDQYWKTRGSKDTSLPNVFHIPDSYPDGTTVRGLDPNDELIIPASCETTNKAAQQ